MLGVNASPAWAASPTGPPLQKPDTTPGLQHANKIGHTDPNRLLSVEVSLALRNEPALESLIAQISDRKSPNYGHYLTAAQFTAAYAPTTSQVQVVANHLQASGLKVASVSA